MIWTTLPSEVDRKTTTVVASVELNERSGGWPDEAPDEASDEAPDEVVDEVVDGVLDEVVNFVLDKELVVESAEVLDEVIDGGEKLLVDEIPASAMRGFRAGTGIPSSWNCVITSVEYTSLLSNSTQAQSPS